MDTEGLKTIAWLLLWGGAFFVMVRYGCGAHITGGHHAGHGSRGEDEMSESKDPVCGMAVGRDKAAAAAVYRGLNYYFCSTSCRDRFEKEPDKYAGTPAQGGPTHGEHHHG